MKQIGIYIHIPFCKRKCNYCDFVSYQNKDEFIEEYVKSVVEEIKDVSLETNQNIMDKKIDGLTVKTIYIGGGTPSYIDSKYIKQILSEIYAGFNVEKNAEITLEINPGTVNLVKIKDYKKIGINRVSIGLQSVNENLLKMLGRIHTVSEFDETYNLVKKEGFSNINIDFMIGLPSQTMQDIDDMINKIEKLKPTHVSIYSLIVEENTPIEFKIRNNELKLPSDELERQMYWRVKNKLEKIGYKHYEISNFALNGFEAKHNVDCWNQKEYMGFGAAAHSYMDKVRFSNIEDVKEYINNINLKKFENNFVFHEKQNKIDEMKEFIILGLRKIDGMECAKFENKFNEDIFEIFGNEIEKLLKEELIEIEEGKIKLSNKGIDLANIVWEEFI